LENGVIAQTALILHLNTGSAMVAGYYESEEKCRTAALAQPVAGNNDKIKATAWICLKLPQETQR